MTSINNLPDYRGEHARTPQSGRSGSYWWKEPKEKLHGAVLAAVRHIDRTQTHKFNAILRAVRMYGSRRIANLGPSTYNVPDATSTRRLRYNIVASTVDTATAFVAKETPRVVALTDGGSFKLQQRAKKLNKFFFGLFTEQGVYDQGPDMFRDGALTGGGIFKVAVEDSQVKIERVFIDELLWDDADAVKGRPRSIYQRVWIARERAMELWPKAKAAIAKAPIARAPNGGAETGMQADMIELVEAWHLRSTQESTDGVHALIIDGATIVKEPYEYKGFPFAVFTYGPAPPKGFVPCGLADKLVGIQIAINRHLDTIESSLQRMAVPRIFVEDTSDVSPAQLNNVIGAIIKYASGSNPPVIDNSNPVATDLFNHLYWTINAGFEIAGINKLSATGEKPEGLNSGAALREFKDIEAVSFSTVQRKYEQTFVDLAEICTWFAADLYKGGVDASVNVPGQRFLDTIKWSEVCMDSNPYTLQVFPTSMLPKQPAARFAQIDEWVQRGWVSKEDAMSLMDMPDLDRANALMSAATEDIEATIDNLLTAKAQGADELAVLEGLSGEDREIREAELVFQRNQPDPIQNLALAMQKVRAQWLISRHQDDVPEARKQLLLDYIRQAEFLLSDQEAAAGAAAATGGVPVDVIGQPAAQPGMQQPPI